MRLSAVVLSSLVVSACGGGGEPSTSPKPTTISEEYPGPWREDTNIGISKALVQRNISGCGQYKYRQFYDGTKNYLVYCTRDGSNWLAYKVWPRETLSSDVMGPYKTESSLPP